MHGRTLLLGPKRAQEGEINMSHGFDKLATMPWYLWLLLAAILFTQSTWLFLDAGKRGAKKWLWGLGGLIQAPTPLLIYLIVVRKIYRKKKI